jgi:hypothetical protein
LVYLLSVLNAIILDFYLIIKQLHLFLQDYLFPFNHYLMSNYCTHRPQGVNSNINIVFMKIKLTAIILFVCAARLTAQTNVGGNYFTNQTWTLSGSPYTVTGNIAVTAGVTLTIQPGVVIKNTDNHTITISGALQAKGTQTAPIHSTGGRILFRRATLSQSQIEYFTSVETHIQIGDETEYVQDNPKNSDTLRISNASFTDADIRSKGYMTSAGMVVKNTSMTRGNITGYYPRSEPIYFINSTFYSTRINSDAYNYGIRFYGCKLWSNNLQAACCGGNLHFYQTDVVNGKLVSGSGYIIAEHTRFINTTITDIQNSTIKNCIFKYGPDNTLNLGSTQISQSSFIGNRHCNSGTGLDDFSGSASNITMVNNQIGLKGRATSISNSNFWSNSEFHFKYTGTTNITASGSYWGTNNSTEIGNRIFDYWEDPNLGKVDYTGFVASPRTDCPMSPPIGLSKTAVGGGVKLTWNANRESDLSGYKIYYGSNDGITFNSSIKIGKDTFYTLAGAKTTDLIRITAYDNQTDGKNDMTDGNESWYSEDAMAEAEILGKDSTHFCNGGQTTLYAKNTPNTTFTWLYYNSPTGNSADSIRITNPGHYHVVASNFNGCKDTSARVVVSSYSLSVQQFTANIICGGSAALKNNVNYTGNQPLSYSWTADPTLSNLSIAQPEASPISQRDYFVRVTDGVCVANSTATVYVNPLTIHAGPDRAAYCSNAVKMAQPTSNYSGSKPLTFRWSPANGLNDTTAEQPMATLRQTRTYRLVVKSSNGCTASDEVTLVLQAQPDPSICLVTTDSQYRNVVVWDNAAVASADSFYVFRDAAGSAFEQIGVVSGKAAGIFTDMQSGAGSFSRRYRISLKDECGLSTSQSPYHRTVHLGISPGVTGQWNLFWNNYEGLNVNSIRIWRGKSKDSMTAIAVISPFNNTFTDKNAPTGDVCYRLSFDLATPCNLSGVNNSPMSNLVFSKGVVTNSYANKNLLHMQVQPNPSTGIFTFSGLTVGHLAIFNTSGQNVVTTKVLQRNTVIDLSGLPVGIYRARFMDEVTGYATTAALVKQ